MMVVGFDWLGLFAVLLGLGFSGEVVLYWF